MNCEQEELLDSDLVTLNTITQEQAKLWLIIYDNEAALFWVRAGGNYIDAVRDNLMTFGPVDDEDYIFGHRRSS